MDGKEYGSLTEPGVTLREVSALRHRMLTMHIFDPRTMKLDSLSDALDAVDALSPLVDAAEMLLQKYDVVATNPPYMGASNMNAVLAAFVKKEYPDSKSDLFAVFIERCQAFAKAGGYQAMITQHAWMFLSSFEKLRMKLQSVDTQNMAHLGARAFEEIGGEVVQTTSFVLRKNHVPGYKGTYVRLIEPTTQQGKEDMFLAGENRYTAQQDNFSKIPGAPVAYWVGEKTLSSFAHGAPLGKITPTRKGMFTGNNDYWLKLWYEIDYPKMFRKFKPYNKGGEYRKWYGNHEFVVDWSNNGENIKRYNGSGNIVPELYFHPCLTWSLVTSYKPSFRAILDNNHVMGDAGPIVVTKGNSSVYFYLLGLLNSKYTDSISALIAPTINFSNGVAGSIPVVFSRAYKETVDQKVKSCITLSRMDWNSYETSWGFLQSPLLHSVESNDSQILFGMKFSEKRWLESLRNGTVCFSPVGDFIRQGQITGNNEQGDKYEGIFARLRRDDSRIAEMANLLKDDLQIIDDGGYFLLRRKSCYTVPVFCIYGGYPEDGRILVRNELPNGDYKTTIAFIPSKRFNNFNTSTSEGNNADSWYMGFSIGHMEGAINHELDTNNVKYNFRKVRYEIPDEGEFFIFPDPDYPELMYKTKHFSYQKESRWILWDVHQTDKYLLKYQSMSQRSVNISNGNVVIYLTCNIKDNPHKLVDCYERWKSECKERFQQLKANEEELNRIFIDIYGLQDELTPEVADRDVTVHRVFDTKEDVPESMKGSNYVRTKRDEVVSLISYAVGCMFGRYSLDVPGLVLAGQPFGEKFVYASVPVTDMGAVGEPIPDAKGDCYLRTDEGLSKCSFAPDRDGILPICDDEYFEDDIVGVFARFLEAAYGKQTLEDNLRFVAEALGGSGAPREVIRAYFLNDFFADHCKTYQKRPIYWLFDSGKKNGFKALIYMHRYAPDTIARIRTDYLHEQQSRYRTAIAGVETRLRAAEGAERVRLSKQLEKLQAQAEEARLYEEKIHHLADQMIAIDLDDGVKVNYAKFADVLAKIK